MSPKTCHRCPSPLKTRNQKSSGLCDMCYSDYAEEMRLMILEHQLHTARSKHTVIMPNTGTAIRMGRSD